MCNIPTVLIILISFQWKQCKVIFECYLQIL